MYKIFLDKNKVFQCNVNIEGASLNESEARLLLESDNFTLSFKGSIESNGSVKIPISKLKGILDENYSGKISLEIIAEDTVFKPWEDKYETDMSKKVQVNFNESQVTESFFNESKPKMSISIIPDEFDTKFHLDEIVKILNKNKVNRASLSKKENQNVFNKLVETYCAINYIHDEQNLNNIKRDLLKNIK